MDVPAARNVRRECPALVGAADPRRAMSCAGPMLAAPTAPIDERDIAAVAVRALCEDGHAGAEYVLTGPQSLSQFEQMATIGDVIGRSLRIEEISPEEARRELLAVMPCVCREYAARRLGCGNRPTRVRDIHGRRDHRIAGANVPRLGHRSRRGVSGVTECILDPSIDDGA